ncbi:MAG: hypothetical protein A3G33_09280 [Omnitrophica bacterium RIFCSPLOWO2_12_FULL_44_17]|uniref:Helix-turn-helix domain-containing protein n=1 Tax=Candidatus Danuiimicrobium aquiferis TaxID=1801832 RepID=A0A1G1KWV3_9BACT|nr:MAG: hypothetical protein A3B72_10080 [Omnitrophica bacterium RIFCSPHIGHO2_02_FULL_45_28]OGW97377.1 MAG: hypothetical protein A3G33_09280 [Omnitrophica bacterium RIFCSPLOWO2_12_FULL_44_17]OGX01878.1 MAG: hypothetical protein A3J12_06490 [Omnitrophica bacterium RIFCSPLOWO2_02_FULL_44_11]
MIHWENNPHKKFNNNEKPADGSAKIMTAQEVSSYLKIPLSTLYGLSKAGKIRAVKVGKHWRYLAEDIEKYLHGEPEKGTAPFLKETKGAVPFSIIPGTHYLIQKKNKLSNVSPDARQFPRINCEIPASMTVLLQRKDEPSRQGIIFNISEGGALFVNETQDAVFQAGDPVRLSFDMEEAIGAPQKIVVIGRIVHFQNGTDSKFGIRFRNLSLEERRMIREYVG